MRVAHLITDLDVGGAEKMLSRLVRAMDPAVVSHLVISMTDAGPLGTALARDGYDVRCLGLRRGRVSAAAPLALRRILREWRADLLETWLYHADLLGTLATVGGTSPTLVWNLRASVMDMRQYGWLSGATRSLCARLSRRPALIIANSEAGVSAHAALGYRPRAWRVLPNGIDTDEYAPDGRRRAVVRSALGIPEAAVVVGVGARYDPMKGHDVLADALADWLPAAPDVHVLVAGAGVGWDAPAYAALARRAPACVPRVHLLGPRDDMPAVWNACDVGCAPSHGEGFPNAVAEAMATGLPVVVTDVGDSAALVAEPTLVVPPAQPGALASTLAGITALPADARQALGARARARVVAHYSIASAAARYAETYRDAVEQR
ncbi:glycosyl transferase [Luteitalea sp. TBR-22]|nr:glycosyl transferase [Luteitalea sp. TBR-22]